jgi:hypothetical protein
MLLNSVDEVATLDAIGRSYRYMTSTVSTTPGTAMPSGILAGSYLRREFIAQSTSRNKMP